MTDESLNPARESASVEKRRLVLNTLANGVSQFASMFASLVFMPMLVSAFGLAEYGLFMLASSVAAYAALLDFGMGSALTKFVAEYRARDDRTALAGSVSSAFLYYTAVGVVVAIVMVAVGAFSRQIFHVDASGAMLLRNMLWLGAVFQIWYWPASTARHVLSGLQRFDLLAATGITATALSIAATVYVLVTGSGPVVLVGLNGAVIALVAALNITLARRLLGIPVLSYRSASRPHLAAIFTFSWAIFVLQLADALFYQQTDRVILGIFAGAAAVGLYEAAAKFNILVTYLSGLTVSAVLPLASSFGAQGRHASLKALLLRGTKYGAALVAPITIVLAVVAEPLIAAWLGPDFDGQALVAQVLVVPHVLMILGVMGDAIVMSKGRLAGRIPYVLAQAAINVVLSVALVGRYGVLGVAIGTAVAHLVDFPFHVRFLLKETGVAFGEWVRDVVTPVYPLLLVPLGISLGLVRTPLVASIPGIVVAALCALVPYWGLLYVFGLAADEKHDVRSGLAAVRGRFSRA
ncbi:MAG: hypothetical protein CVT60_01375 [Actinobacteria bacterium HGW-Actinobacteria-10]|nr:MAG: hypothetical protein CVT60_01375 [Actinobacteria bacterium HGW-Actinobacteria-10]